MNPADRFDIQEFGNGLLRNMAAAQTGARFKCVPCGSCRGSGKYSWTYQGIECQDACWACNGRAVVIVERDK